MLPQAELLTDDIAVTWVFPLRYEEHPQMILDADEYLNKPTQRILL